MFLNALLQSPTPNGSPPLLSALFPQAGTSGATLSFADLFAPIATGKEASVLPSLPPHTPALTSLDPVAILPASLTTAATDTAKNADAPIAQTPEALLATLKQWESDLAQVVATLQSSKQANPQNTTLLTQLQADVKAVIGALEQTLSAPLVDGAVTFIPDSQLPPPVNTTTAATLEAPLPVTVDAATAPTPESLLPTPVDAPAPTPLQEAVTQLQSSLAAVVQLPVITATMTSPSTHAESHLLEKRLTQTIRTAHTLQQQLAPLTDTAPPVDEASTLLGEAKPVDAASPKATALPKPDTFQAVMDKLSIRDASNTTAFIQLQTIHSQPAAPASTPAPYTPNLPQPVPEQLSFHLKKAISDGLETMRISLQPAALGHVQVDLHVDHDGVLKAVIAVEKPDTLDMLQRDARGLEKALADVGIKTDNSSLQFSLKQDNGGFGQHLQQQFGERHNAPPQPANTDTPVDASLTAKDDPLQPHETHYHGTLSRVDVTV